MYTDVSKIIASCKFKRFYFQMKVKTWGSVYELANLLLIFHCFSFHRTYNAVTYSHHLVKELVSMYSEIEVKFRH